MIAVSHPQHPYSPWAQASCSCSQAYIGLLSLGKNKNNLNPVTLSFFFLLSHISPRVSNPLHLLPTFANSSHVPSPLDFCLLTAKLFLRPHRQGPLCCLNGLFFAACDPALCFWGFPSHVWCSFLIPFSLPVPPCDCSPKQGRIPSSKDLRQDLHLICLPVTRGHWSLALNNTQLIFSARIPVY